MITKRSVPALLRHVFLIMFGVTVAVGLFAFFTPFSAGASPLNERVDVLIEFTMPPGLSEQLAVRGLGGEVRDSFHIVRAVSARVPAAAIPILERHPLVKTVELDGMFYAIGHESELNNTWGVKHIGAGDVHHNGIVGSGIKIAIVDSGIDYNHPDLAGNYAGGYDFVNNDGDPKDDNGHGTHVAGTAGALLNDAGVVGAAPSVSLYGLKVLSASGGGSFSNVIKALDWAVANGIQVANHSYGSGSNPGSIVQAAFDNSAAAGVLHIAAAGNSGSCGGSNNTVGYPARYASVVAVAATDKNDKRPCFSSTGPDVELSAPGVSINSTVPGGGYASWNGTSMASPHVAGVAALVMAAGETSAAAVRQILRDTAKDIGAGGKDNHYGYGLVQALAAVSSVTPPPPPAEEPPVEEEPVPPPEEEDPAVNVAAVSSISYANTGSRGRDLTVTLTVSDADGNPVENASISITLKHESGSSWKGSSTTRSNGTASFTLRRAPAGCYTTEVTNVSADGLEWDGVTPSNGHCR